jgi:glyoxylase-like metal-dependent hydrolase (beta-lactamase superfamily II)/8-oxo-dGTP pyrophosphatase MutT (NUDIX family)
VLLARGSSADEVLLVRRADELRFFGGFWAFPGGKIAPEDGDLGGGEAGARLLAAARELFEETGILVARRPDGSFPTSSTAFNAARLEVMENRMRFAAFLEREHLQIRASDYLLIGQITTPEFAPQRFATTFFVAPLPPGQEAVVWPGELVESAWLTAAAMLDRWKRGEVLLSPPTAMTLEAIAGRPALEAPARLAPLFRELAAGAMHPIYFAPCVQMLPLRTPALPPITHTNAFFLGAGPCYLIDPGPQDAAEQARLFMVLDAHRAAGRPLTAVVLSHHHSDHIGAAAATARHCQVPIWAHQRTAEALRGRLTVDRLLAEGDRLDLGRRPDGGGSWYLEVQHTPGHAWGHLTFFDPFYRLLFAGDMVSTSTSVLIPPQDGDLAIYLQSLRRLADLPARLLLPGHGNVSARSRQTILDALEHRAVRERQLLDALAPAARTIEELALELYRGLPEGLMRFACLQIRAGLEKLQREGRAQSMPDGRWQLC